MLNLRGGKGVPHIPYMGYPIYHNLGNTYMPNDIQNFKLNKTNIYKWIDHNTKVKKIILIYIDEHKIKKLKIFKINI